jgi:hypothetical protein
MRMVTARKVVNSEKLAGQIAKARGRGSIKDIQLEAKSLLRRLHKRERQRRSGKYVH